MTDAPKDGDNELVLDWDDAVESFRLDLEGSARAESAPFPQRVAAPTEPPEPTADLALKPEPEPDFSMLEANEPDFSMLEANEPENERPTLPPQASIPPGSSDSLSLSLSVFESIAPLPDNRIGPFPPRRGSAPMTPSSPSATSTTPPAASPLPSAFGRTLSGLAPVSPRPSNPLTGGLFVQQRATVRPEPEPAPPQKAPSEEQPTRPSATEPTPREPSPRPRMYQPAAPKPELLTFDEDDSDATQVAAVPRELLEALLAGTANRQTRNNRVTERPPVPAPTAKLSEPELTTEELDPDDSDADFSDLELIAEKHEEDDDERYEQTSPQILRPSLAGAHRGLPPAPPEIATRGSLPAISRGSLPAIPRVSLPAIPHGSLPGMPRVSRLPELANASDAPLTDAELTDLDELLPPLSPLSDKPVPLVKVPKADHGAKAAQHTVTATKPRVAEGPLSSESGKRARVALLEALARRKDGRAQALLLVSAAELSEELNDHEGAKDRYTRAHAAAPKLLSPIWALARFAFEARNVDEHLAWLTRAADAADSPRTRAAALATSARVHWLAQRELPDALRAATEAARLCPEDIGHRLLETRLILATRAQQSDAGLSSLAGTVQDDALAASFLVFAGRAREAREEHSSAREAYVGAAARAPTAPDAMLSLARLLRATGANVAAGEALAATLPSLQAGVLATSIRRHAAVLLASSPERVGDAVLLLGDAPDAASARTAYALTSRAADAGAAQRARSAWIRHSEGHERALAWVTEAEQRIRAGHHPEAAQALEEALSLDRSLILTRVLWEVLARQSGDLPSYLQRTAGDTQSGLLRAAAKLACEKNAATAEVELLLQITGERDVAVARALRLDAHAENARLDAVVGELTPLLRDVPSPSLLITLADVLRRQQGEEAAQALLAQGADLYPDDPVITRAWARAAERSEDTVRGLLLEAGSARGARAAFLQLLAGQLSPEPSARLAAFERAYEALPSYSPAVFALHSEARRQNELTRLAHLHTRESARAKDPFEAVSHLLRAALVRAIDDGDAAAGQLTRALDLAPSDPVLRELVIRLGDSVPATLRAEAMQRTAERASPPFDRAAMLAAAGAFEDAGQADRALALYETVLRTHPEDPISEMGRERVARAAGRSRELLEAKRRAIHDASTDARRVRALEDLLQADTDAPAEESLDRARALLVLSPTHPLALRRAERHAMERADLDMLIDTELRLLGSSSGPKDKLARLRLLFLLTTVKRSERARADELDKVIVDHAASAFGGPWLSRQLMGAGVALGDANVVLNAIDMFAAETHDPVELSSLAVRRARIALPDPPHDREDKLRQSLEGYPDHPTGCEASAELALTRGDSANAARLFGEAAEKARHPARVARLWALAGRLFEELKDAEKAKAAYTKAVDADVTFEDVEAKLRALCAEESDLEGLSKVIQARLTKGVSAEQSLKLRLQLAQLHEQRGAPKEAITALREALEPAPDDLGILRELARLLAHDKDHRERAQVLLRIARLSREPVELRDVFMQLGEIYDHELPDPKRAEAAYQRALKLGPRHVPAYERLAALYAREGQQEQAEACLRRLVELADSERKRLDATLALSRSQEARGDARAAEETLEGFRHNLPADAGILRALADFYRRQGALSALAMHLNRATADLRSVVENDPTRTTEWLSLVAMLEEKHRPDAARVAASAALACGVQHERLRPHVDAEGEVPGVASAAFSELLDDLVFGDDMPASTRIVFRHGAEALNKGAPLDLRSVGGERLDRRHPLRNVVNEVARWAGMSDLEVFTTVQLPLAFVPVSDTPAQLLVGQSLLDSLSRKEQIFLTARALKIARANMSITCRVRPDEMGLLLHGLIRSQLPGYAPEGIDLNAVDEMARRVGKHLNRRVVPELLPHLMELMGAATFDPARVYAVASTAGNRAGLLAAGSLGAALSALAKLAGLKLSGAFDRDLLDKVEEARDLLSFSISEAHFEARLRAGVDLR